MWVGDPDHGFGPSQPGGWLYHILPQLEQTPLANLGSRGTPQEKRLAAETLSTTPLPIANCPSRRAPKLYRHRPDATGVINRPLNPGIGGERVEFEAVRMVARSCYVMNGGSNYIGDLSGPQTIDVAATYPFPSLVGETGIISHRSRFPLAMVRDGLSNTYLLGEKYLNPTAYENWHGGGDAQNMYIGYDQDTARWGRIDTPPMRDRRGFGSSNAFGGPHDSGFIMAMCDGSVTSIGYEIDGLLHERLACRNDGEPASLP